MRSLADVVEIKKGEDMKSKSRETKPSIVFCHGIWADGSCFNKVIPTLQADGHQVIAAQYGLDSLASDVDASRKSDRTVALISFISVPPNLLPSGLQPCHADPSAVLSNHTRLERMNARVCSPTRMI